MTTLKQDCLEHGIPYRTVQNRMYNEGLSRAEALALGNAKRGGRAKHVHMWKGKLCTFAELGLIMDLKPDTMGRLIKDKGLALAMTPSTKAINKRYAEEKRNERGKQSLP